MTPGDNPMLTREQETTFLEWKPWQKRQTERLTRRFGKWVPAWRIAMLVEDATLRGVAHFDERRGVPLGAYLLKCAVGAVWDAARRARKLVLKAYLACASSAEWWLADPNIIHGTDEERLSTLERLAQQGATAIVLAGAYSRDTATGGEDAVIDALDGARVRAAVGGLDDRRREVVERRYGEDSREELTKEQPATGGSGKDEKEEDERALTVIAKAMGLGLITVRRAHADALDELRARFA